ncbi:peroxide stress protein YaaA [Acidaminococcus fermentans]|uniref:peroxide stress protein YaaA n=1 Tax=Acidaminococcus fermentans TaxID=905 RepID=UPI002433145C|nr:peroxide stress protein YaaA [Acidaminococcus fermentans]
MRLIISPAKKMRVDLESGCACTPPFFLPETRQLLSWLRSLSFGQLRTLWACSQSLAEENWERLRQMDLEKAATPALLAYGGRKLGTAPADGSGKGGNPGSAGL